MEKICHQWYCHTNLGKKIWVHNYSRTQFFSVLALFVHFGFGTNVSFHMLLYGSCAS